MYDVVKASEKGGGNQVEELDYMDFEGLIGCEIFNRVNVYKSCENQEEPEMTLLLKRHLIHFMCRKNVW